MRTPDVAARNVVVMAGSRGAAGALPRASARTRRPSARALAQRAECDHANKPQAAGGARRGGRSAATEGLSPPLYTNKSFVQIEFEQINLYQGEFQGTGFIAKVSLVGVALAWVF